MLKEIREALSKQLGIPEDEVSYNLLDVVITVELRIPGPGESAMDFLDEGETDDIIGAGADLEEALENAVSAYRHKKSRLPFAFVGRTPFELYKPNH